jgi:hypothetical protein
MSLRGGGWLNLGRGLVVMGVRECNFRVHPRACESLAGAQRWHSAHDGGPFDGPRLIHVTTRSSERGSEAGREYSR